MRSAFPQDARLFVGYNNIRSITHMSEDENKNSKIWPSWKTQNLIYNKGDYDNNLRKKGRIKTLLSIKPSPDMMSILVQMNQLSANVVEIFVVL